MFVREQKKPIKILYSAFYRMTKIETVMEFKNIIQSKFGFIVVSSNQENTIHLSDCVHLKDKFTEVGNSFHWFSTISMAERSFQVTPCSTCTPE